MRCIIDRTQTGILRSMIRLMARSCSLFLILLAVTGCDREEDERFPSGHHDPIEGDGEMVSINVKVDGVDEFLGGAVTRSGEILTKIVQPLDSTYDSGYDVCLLYTSRCV